METKVDLVQVLKKLGNFKPFAKRKNRFQTVY